MRSRSRFPIAVALAVSLVFDGAILLVKPTVAEPAPIPAAITLSDTCGTEAACAEVPGRAPAAFHALRMSAGGLPAGDPAAAALCGRGIHPRRAVAVPDGAGGIVVAWIEPNEPDDLVRALRRDSTGNVVSGWPSAGVVLCAAPGPRGALALAPDGAGGALAAWIDHRDVARGRLYAQRVDAAGAIVSGWSADGMAVSNDPADQIAAALAADGAGGGYFAWQRTRPTGPQVRTMRLAANGARAAGWADTGLVVCAHDSAQAAPIATSDGTGGVLVAWEDQRAGAAANLYATRLTASGALSVSWPSGGARVSTASAAQRFARMIGDGAGGAYLAWQDARSGAGRLYAQRLAAAGSVSPGWAADGIALATGSAEQFDGTIATDGSGGLLAGWIDYRGGAAGDIYLQRLASNGVRAAGWPAAGATVCTDPGDAFHPTLGDVLAGASTLAWDDAGEGAVVTGVGDAVPLPERLAIQWISRGLARGSLLVRLALVSRDAATLDVLDVAGRRIGRHPIEALGAGWHVVALDSRLRFSPGVYFVRLSQGGRSVVTKAIVLQ